MFHNSLYYDSILETFEKKMALKPLLNQIPITLSELYLVQTIFADFDVSVAGI